MPDNIEWDEKSPSFPWYVKDWLTDTNLRRCSRQARAVWADALCYMWLAPVKGHLDCESREELCELLGGGTAELSPLIDELIKKKAASSDGPGSLINRRMYRQAKLKQTRSESGSNGGKKSAEKRKQVQEVAGFAQANTPSKPPSEIKQNGLPPSPSPSPSPSLSSKEESVCAPTPVSLNGSGDFKFGKHIRLPREDFQEVQRWYLEQKHLTQSDLRRAFQILDSQLCDADYRKKNRDKIVPRMTGWVYKALLEEKTTEGKHHRINGAPRPQPKRRPPEPDPRDTRSGSPVKVSEIFKAAMDKQKKPDGDSSI